MRAVVFHVDAENELEAAIAWYDGERCGLGGQLRKEVEAAVRRIRRSPKRFAADDKFAVRTCRVHRFPFTIKYLEVTDQIWIAAVAHHSRRPGYWRNRRP